MPPGRCRLPVLHVGRARLGEAWRVLPFFGYRNTIADIRAEGKCKREFHKKEVETAERLNSTRTCPEWNSTLHFTKYSTVIFSLLTFPPPPSKIPSLTVYKI